MDKIEKLINKLKKESIKKELLSNELIRSEIAEEDVGLDVYLEYLKSCGLPILEDEDGLTLSTRKTSYTDQVYCFVDIETNGNSPYKDQIIELGAIKYKQGQIVEHYESFVYAKYIPDYITNITKITSEDVADATSLKEVLCQFRIFLADSVFVAHNVNFDYNFIYNSFKHLGLEKMLNRQLCTINLAKKTIKAEKYGLGFLREYLNIDTGVHHRAYADAFSAMKVFEESLKNIPKNVKTVEDLIFFSNPNQKKKKKKKKLHGCR